MSKAFKPQTPGRIALNRLRRASQHARRMRRQEVCNTPRGTMRAKRRLPKNMPIFRAQQQARLKASTGTFTSSDPSFAEKLRTYQQERGSV